MNFSAASSITHDEVALSHVGTFHVASLHHGCLTYYLLGSTVSTPSEYHKYYESTGQSVLIFAPLPASLNRKFGQNGSQTFVTRNLSQVPDSGRLEEMNL